MLKKQTNYFFLFTRREVSEGKPLGLFCNSANLILSSKDRHRYFRASIKSESSTLLELVGAGA
jgi:hypothetical protein